jgi:hypothetical protein
MNATVTIAGKNYEAAPLRLKHLRLISEKLASGIPAPKSSYDDVAPWLPLVLDCLKVNHPELTIDSLDEMSGQEFYDAWQAIIEVSKVKMDNAPMAAKVKIDNVQA